MVSGRISETRCINTMPSGPKPVAMTMLGAKFSKPQRRTVSGELPSNSAPNFLAISGVHSTVSMNSDVLLFTAMTIPLVRRYKFCLLEVFCEPVNLFSQSHNLANHENGRWTNAWGFFNNIVQCASYDQLIWSRPFLNQHGWCIRRTTMRAELCNDLWQMFNAHQKDN